MSCAALGLTIMAIFQSSKYGLLNASKTFILFSYLTHHKGIDKTQIGTFISLLDWRRSID